ncbi:class I SAM-dependent methyltransferase [Paenibacillus agri]|uniref:Methyltransferase domain-containing protein n=1 Tax=Paenibacillus agri TaxID=2744309 RepID=A0A850F1W2_9BACL|nr:methyltransferase domain-containing protein [Paenibacillus agri]NUU64031.1 methyltransferase domain-containing protein [Paenibacillus agri]
MHRNLHDALLFFYKFLRMPMQIGSITPSSASLAKKMIEYVPWQQATAIAELGAGSGAITQYIASAKSKHTQVLLFEKDVELRQKLTERYPGFPSYPDASRLDTALRQQGLEDEKLDCILSGLPFFNFPQQLRDILMEQISTALKPGGLFIAFQYSQQMRKQLHQQFEIEHVHFVPLNMPPAFVYVCRKKPPLLHSDSHPLAEGAACK